MREWRSVTVSPKLEVDDELRPIDEEEEPEILAVAERLEAQGEKNGGLLSAMG